MGKSKITNCWTSGSIYSGTKIEKNIGGIVGVTVQGCTISGCYSTATLTGNFNNSEGYYKNPNALPPDTIGGIVGARFDGDLTVTDCWFDGEIVVNSLQAAVGGIVGYADDGTTIQNCLVATTDIGKDPIEEETNTYWVGYLENGNSSKQLPGIRIINIKQRLWAKMLIMRQAQLFLILNLLMFLKGLKTMQEQTLTGLQASSTLPLNGTREIFLRTIVQ